jgi:two-component system, LytTR family, sensor kinase
LLLNDYEVKNLLYIGLLERMALIVVAAYIYNQSHIFKNLIKTDLNIVDKLGMIFFFSTVAIIGTYTGINLEPYAIANTRPLGAILAGYIGGPVIGIIVGLIAGTHRLMLGGFTAVACAISTVLEGIIGALGRKYLARDNEYSLKAGFFTGVIAEIAQVLVVITVAKPFSNALNLERVIALPMIFINSVGVVIILNIIQNAKQEYDRIGAVESQKALNIANRTLDYMRIGLNKETARKVAEIICEIGNIRGVFIAGKEEVLTYYGDEIDTDKLKINWEAYNLKRDCSVIEYISYHKKVFFLCIPISIKDNEYVGVIGFKVKSEKDINKYFVEFSKELTGLLSTQIELHMLNEIAQEATKAELRALRAQIHPHFLFNALNTISSFCRTNPDKARYLIINLSNYFRQTLKKEEDFVPLEEELIFLRSYLAIEKARFGDRLRINIDIPESIMHIKMPVFVLQPLIENAIKHGILPTTTGGNVLIKASLVENKILFMVEDTGVGMSIEKYNKVINNCPGIGLNNVNKRLKLLYGEDHTLNIKTSLGEGTKISFLIPKEVI